MKKNAELTTQQRELLNSQSKLFMDKTYKIWHSMKQRCTNPNSKSYCNYGGNGIEICEEWLNINFYRLWLIENGYEPQEGKITKDTLTVDRINPDDDYSPDNCRIISHGENSAGSRKLKYLKDYKQVFVYHINGLNTGESYQNNKMAAREMNLKSDKISECCIGTRNSHGGYRFSYNNRSKLKLANTRVYKDFKGIHRETKEEKVFKFKKDAAAYIKSSTSNISKVLTGDRLYAKGWHFEYID